MVSNAIPPDKRPQILAFYSHISRMYNSAINTLTAIIFGWISFVGIALKVVILWVYEIIFISFFFLMASYIYRFRILRQGKFIAKMENDLELRDYIRNELLPLDKTLPFGKFFEGINLSERPNDDPEEMSLVEKISGVTIVIFYPLTILLLFVP